MKSSGSGGLETAADLEATVAAEGARLFDLMEKAPPPAFFSQKGAYARLMEWAMKDPAFKAQLFRFVDVLPSLTSSDQVVQHLQEYLGDRAVQLSPSLKFGLSAAKLAPGVLAATIRTHVQGMAREFVAGESPEDLVKRFRANAHAGIATTIDLLGETVLTEAEADTFLQRNIDVLNTLAAAIQREPEPCFSDHGASGPLPRLNLSVKVSALTPDVNPADPQTSLRALQKRLRPLLRRAAEVNAFINFDMESYRFKDLTFELFRAIFSDPEFREKPGAGIAIQAYLRDSGADLDALIAWASRIHRPVTVRLVKGAYWDYETTLALQRGWPIPVFEHKEHTDAQFERLSARLLEAHREGISAAFATHNVRSCAHAIGQAKALGLDPRAFEFQALYGMADDLKQALLSAGYRVREYCPIGQLLPGMAYLVRRLLENTSNEGFLRARHAGAVSRAQLLRKPTALREEATVATEKAPDRTGAFRNCANTDFARPEAREALQSALNKLRRTQPANYALLIGGRAIVEDHELVASLNPARPDDVIGRWTRGTLVDADLAIAAARTAQPKWARCPVSERAAVFERLADILESRRFELSALEILEAGKPWVEADADVSEAIDFCRFYAQEARQLCNPRATQQTPGESNFELHVPRGIGVVIAPWNFPLAILCGMTVAAAVSGNAVIMKPAEQTSVIAAKFMQAMIDAGVPAGVVNLLTGFGEDVGAYLVAHEAVDFVAFTGSKGVGLHIWETVGKTRPGQRNLKRAICEMGGKNAMIIDADADWDEAIPAALYSAFGFAGQKCSALARLIVHADIAEAFTERLAAAAAALKVGDPAEPGTLIGPVIDAEADRRIHDTIVEGQREARQIFQADFPPALAATGGYYVRPTIFAGVKPNSMLARQEIFGPVLAILTAKDLDEAIQLANDSEYALTAGIFSRSPHALERARDELVAGNIYLNRGITGAMVERHPFGGYRMSGGGSKAGGRGYLENFMFPRAVSENVMRRGFVPSETP
jgi:RHH-type transcriptional regulator, proline utilization regulon repressor / proline dehydrogenase / delta 1-pyrroline-5-carboxylate dehydrogenase